MWKCQATMVRNKIIKNGKTQQINELINKNDETICSTTKILETKTEQIQNTFSNHLHRAHSNDIINHIDANNTTTQSENIIKIEKRVRILS